MTPQEFYNGPYRQTLEAGELECQEQAWVSNVVWFEKADRCWRTICHRVTLPMLTAVNHALWMESVRRDVARMVALCIQLATYLDSTENILTRSDAIMRPKMMDYGSDENFAINFIRSAERARLDPSQVWVVFADKHFGAICNFVQHEKLESEDVRDRIADLINYCTLLMGMIVAKVIE